MTLTTQVFRAALACAAAAHLLLSAPAVPTPPETPAPRARPGPMDVLEADPRNLMYSYGPTGNDLVAARNQGTNASASITVTYDAGFAAQPEAQAAFQAAVDIWSNVISSPAPIRIRAQFTTLGATTLGSAGPTVTCTATGGIPNTYYAAALADKIRGFAYCANLGSETHEITANFNSSFSNWDFGTSGTPISGRYNFLTVVMHEIGHGLGFYGRMTASGGIGGYSSLSPYDRFAETGSGTSLLAFTNPSSALGAQLVSNDTYFDGTNANANNSGQRPKLETRFFSTNADNGFRAGSSYSHADDVLYTGTPNGLMTYSLGTGEVYTDPGPIVRGMFADIGWNVADPRITIESPASNATVSSAFTFSGWAIDRGAASGTGVNAVHVYATPSGGSPVLLGAATYGSARSDIASLYGSQFTNSGFSLSVSGLAAGAYQLTAYAYSTVTQTFAATATVSITVTSVVSQPVMALDSPQNNTTIGRTVEITGWAIDRGATATSGVDTIHVWVYSLDWTTATFVGVGAYGTSRPDIGSVFGSTRFTPSGFSLTVNSTNLAAGSYNLVAFGRSTVTGSFTVARVVRVTVQ